MPEIEKGIPIPPLTRREEAKDTELYRKMEVGDSIFSSWNPKEEERLKLQHRINARLQRLKPKKFAMRQWPPHVPEGYRIWRVK